MTAARRSKTATPRWSAPTKARAAICLQFTNELCEPFLDADGPLPQAQAFPWKGSAHHGAWVGALRELQKPMKVPLRLGRQPKLGWIAPLKIDERG
jgi:hypothetical protein